LLFAAGTISGLKKSDPFSDLTVRGESGGVKLHASAWPVSSTGTRDFKC